MSLQFEINEYKTLIERYPTWDELHKYLESDEGGLFRIVDKNENGFCLIRYEKGTTKMNLPHSKWFRSVVWNTNANRPVCIAPPKAASQEFPYKSFDELFNAGVVCQELFEGFMINCFKVVGDETLYITSRSKLNAAGKFYSDKSFRELFIEAYTNMTDCTESTIQDKSQDFYSPDSSKNEIAVFYSFLVQHTDHKIVKPIEKNSVYLIHSGVVYDDGRVGVEDSPRTIKCASQIENYTYTKQVKGSYAQVAARVVSDDNEQSEVQQWIKSTLLNNDWTYQGLVFKDGEGNRWKFSSEKYAAVKTLRGNSPTIRERFAQLYCQNLIHKYLEYYPDEAFPMTIHLVFMNSVIKMIYDFYVDLHITKVKKAEEIDKMYLPHLYNIHGLYLSQLRPEGKKVNVNEITLYLHKQPWQRVSFLIKKIVDGINTEPVGASV
jgi:hypothetical protein